MSQMLGEGDTTGRSLAFSLGCGKGDAFARSADGKKSGEVLAKKIETEKNRNWDIVLEKKT